MTPLHIVAIDDDQGQLDDACEAITEHCKILGYQAEIKKLLVEEGGGESARSSLLALMESRPDFLFCDNQLGSAPGLASWGFHIIAEMKQVYPDCVFVLITREALDHKEFAKAFPHPDIIVDKQRLNTSLGIDVDDEQKGRMDGIFKRFLHANFVRNFKRTRIGSLVIPPNVVKLFEGLKAKRPPGSPPKRAEIASLVEQICFMGRRGPENRVACVTLGALEVANPGPLCAL